MSMKLNSNQVGLPSLLKEGYKRNISACKALTEITSSSFGPNGLNKLVVNTLDKLFVTNDAGTIMRELEVEHPAARLLLMASQQQDKEVGDGTNFVVLLAGQLLQNAEDLLRIGIRPPLIVEGYELAYKKALEVLETLVVETATDFHDKQAVKAVVKTVIASKQYGWEGILADLVSEAVQVAFPKDSKEFNPDNVRCVKIVGGSLPMSHVIAGMLLEREPLGRVHQVSKAKIAVFACPINVTRTETKGTVLIRGAQDLLDFGKGEEKILSDQIKAIYDSGVNVVVTGETIGELAMHFIERAGILAVKIPSKFDLRRLCKAVNATPLARLGAPTEEEAGFCDRVETVEISGTRCTVFRQLDSEKSRLATIVLRSNTPNVLDDLERALEDSLFTVRNLARDGRLVAGAGAFEIEMARQLVTFGETTPGIAQYAIKKYAEAFEAVPRIIASNAGYNSTEVVSKLHWAHNQGQASMGVDICGGDGSEIFDAAHVAELLAVKRSAMHLATEAALTVLRVDQIIMSKPAGGPKPRPAGAQDADD